MNSVIDEGNSARTGSVLQRVATLTIESDDIHSRGVNGLMVVLLVSVALLLLYATYTIGPAATSRYVGDDFILFDGAWRSYNDQISSNEFYNPMGFFYFFVFGSVMKFLGPQVTTVAYTIVAVNLALVLWCWNVFRWRMSFAMAIALTIAIAAQLFSNKIYGHEYFILGYAEYYNKVGFTLLSIIFALSFLSKHGTEKPPVSTLAAIGFALGLTFAVKISHFMIAMPSVILGLSYFYGASARRLAWGAGVILLAGLVTAGLLSLVTGTSLSSYLADLTTASQARSFVAPFTVLKVATKWYYILCVVLVGAVVMYLLPRNDRGRLWQTLCLAGLGLATIAVLDLTNAAPTEFQFLCTLLAVLCSFNIGRDPLIAEAARLQGSHGAALRSSYLALLFFPFAVVVLIGVLSGGYGLSLTYSAVRNPERALTIPTEAMAGWRGVGLREVEPDLVKSVQAGVQILTDIATPEDTVQVLDYTNPFSFALGLPPAEDGALWWHPTYNMSPEKLVDIARGVPKACIVMYPLRPFHAGIRDLLFSAIEQDIESSFDVFRENEYWRVFLNRSCR